MAAAKASLLIAVLAIWQLAALRGLPEYVLSPVQIARYFVAGPRHAELYENIGGEPRTRSLPGFALGSSLGALLGLAAGTARWFDRMLEPGGVPHLPGAEDRDAADLHDLVRHRRPVARC